MRLEHYQKSYALHGMPCHKYIVRNLKNTRDIIVFEKSFLKTMLSNGYDENTSLDSLGLMEQFVPIASPISGIEFSQMGDGVDFGDFLPSIIADVTIPEYTCSEYYSLCDEKCSACSNCIYSTSFANFYIEEERTILRYVLASEENLSHLKNLGLKASVFHSVIDIVDVISSATHPINFMLYRSVYKMINSSAARYFGSEDAGKSFGSRIRTKLADDVFKFNLPQECYCNDWQNKLVSIWEDELFSLSICTREEAEACLDKLVKKRKYIPPVVGKYKEPVKADILPNKTATAATAPIKKSGSAKSSKTVAVGTPVKEPSQRASSASVVGGVNKDSNSRPQKGALSADKPRNKSSSCAQDSLKFELSTEYVEVVDNSALANEESVSVESKVVNPYDTFPRSIDMGNNLIYIPRIESKELSYCCTYLDSANVSVLTSFENAVVRDKRMCVEMVFDENEHSFLLIWVSRLQTYFYTDFISLRSNEIVFSLFSKRSISKISYSAYWIYSTIYDKNHGQIRGLRSIQSMQYLLSVKNTDYVSVLLSYGINPSLPGKDFRSSRWVDSLIFRLMPGYAVVCRKQMRLILSNDLEERLTELSYFDEAVGTSYDMSKWLGKKDFLFTMPRPFFFRFRRVDFDKLSADGYVLSLTLHCDIEPIVPIFRTLLCRMAEAGRFRSLRLQLLDVADKSLVVFVKKEHFEVALEFINRTLFDVLEGKHELGVSVDTKYKLVEREKIAAS